MIQVENINVFGWEAAIRGMRNPMNSWDKSDSGYKPVAFPPCNDMRIEYVIGENDLKLMKSLSKAGNDHAKFLRMINVTVDITAPFYWWKEFDTYKIGTVANSCSTMHKIHAKELTLDDFSIEHLTDASYDMLEKIIAGLNSYREDFIRRGDKDDWWQIIQMLPCSYNQKRTVQLNYQVLKSMYTARWNHKLDEWVYFCEWMHDLPHFCDICLNN